MKSTSYKSIDVPIRLHLEFDQITVGELSNLLRQWQALLRAAWRESYDLRYPDHPIPNARILVVSTSSESSCDFVAVIAVHLPVVTSLIGPVRDWPALATAAYLRIGEVWSAKTARDDSAASNHLYMRGGETPEISVNAEDLGDPETGPRIERMWNTANSGGVGMTFDGPNEDDEDSPEDDDGSPEDNEESSSE